ncbi:voltage-gated potassium channel [Kribbella antiqua]|uniref:Voltage-gated potassium channel n=1 Tax=Kribbella antiqua TaxID=2512217 RepID=A0A4R2I9B3_9ACTN|nr:potassium channel family protein [Kribbella antiqua]TCO41013.1 voltage-gated potassium channel [Kribbella antiqua]
MESSLATYERRTGWPLTVAAVVFLVVYAWPILDPGISADLSRACSVANVTIWAMFAIDYVVRLGLATSKPRFVRAHIGDLLVLALPLLRPLRALRVVTAIARIDRASASLRVQILSYVIGAVVLLALVAAVAVLDAERGSAGANITSFSDALWWAAATITTVGYGDTFPTTAEGRLVAVALMIAGIALLGTITASLAAWFLEHVQTVEQASSESQAELAELTAEVRALRAQLSTNDRMGSSSPETTE